MVITYHGGECFKVQVGDTVLVFNPPAKESPLIVNGKTPRFGADIVLVSLNDEDFNGVQNMTYGDKTPFVVSGPGEYEIKNIFIKGIASTTRYKEVDRINTAYLVLIDGVNLCFLGAFGSTEAAGDIDGAFGEVDVLFVPIGGGDVLTSAQAGKVLVGLGPKFVVPMHYLENVKESSLDEFLKEERGEEMKPVAKLTLKKRDLEGKEGEIIVFSQV
ncbi:hypothetical protein AUJ44_03190 [Candidatus Nomurabacteria bacterium CG1_02_47_685]|nr:MAG: hypothetical protein AUJ44_03190 [Candidatus Nomurabacteria bacterium CG1_02_47_685]